MKCTSVSAADLSERSEVRPRAVTALFESLIHIFVWRRGTVGAFNCRHLCALRSARSGPARLIITTRLGTETLRRHATCPPTAARHTHHLCSHSPAISFVCWRSNVFVSADDAASRPTPCPRGACGGCRPDRWRQAGVFPGIWDRLFLGGS